MGLSWAALAYVQTASGTNVTGWVVPLERERERKRGESFVVSCCSMNRVDNYVYGRNGTYLPYRST